MTLDKAIKENKGELKAIIFEFEKELNNKAFKTIYDNIDNAYIVPAFTALLLKNNINPLEYMNEVPSYFAYELDIKEIIIPNNITHIGYSAFENCSGLTEITIPSGVTSIGYGVFSDCTKLTEITIPDSIISINDDTFAFCSSLTSITIPDSVTIIGDFAFQGCKNLKSITTPNNVRYIGSDAFKDCISLTNITIPKSVKTISYYAFDGCYNLTDIYYTGSEEDWKNIKIYTYGNKELLNANIHYNS